MDNFMLQRRKMEKPAQEGFITSGEVVGDSPIPEGFSRKIGFHEGRGSGVLRDLPAPWEFLP